MNPIAKLYYQLTAYVPRKLPRTPEGCATLRSILIDAYGVIDDDNTTVAMSGQIASTPGHLIRKSYGHIANHIKRIEINAVANEFRANAQQRNRVRMEELTKKMIEAHEAEERAKSDQEAKEQPQTDAEPKFSEASGGEVSSCEKQSEQCPDNDPGAVRAETA